jgi:hypothetical protein
MSIGCAMAVSVSGGRSIMTVVIMVGRKILRDVRLMGVILVGR